MLSYLLVENYDNAIGVPRLFKEKQNARLMMAKRVAKVFLINYDTVLAVIKSLGSDDDPIELNGITLGEDFCYKTTLSGCEYSWQILEIDVNKYEDKL